MFDGATRTLVLNWILKGHSMINCPKEFEPDILNTFSVRRGVKRSTPNFTKNVWAHWPFCHPEHFAVSLRIFQPKSQTFHQLLRVTSSLNVCGRFVSSESRMLMRKNLNNDVNKDSPIVSRSGNTLLWKWFVWLHYWNDHAPTVVSKTKNRQTRCQINKW